MLEKLKVGMTEQQVRFVMGSPTHTPVFTHNRWEYFYSLKKSDQAPESRRLTVYFDDDGKVSKIVHQPQNGNTTDGD